MSYESGSAEAIAMAGARLPVSLPVRGLFRKDHGQGFPPWSFRFCSFQPADPTQEINLGERKGRKKSRKVNVELSDGNAWIVLPGNGFSDATEQGELATRLLRMVYNRVQARDDAVYSFSWKA